MASEQPAYWCGICKRFVLIEDSQCRHRGVHYIPAAALDAHTAEVVERCEQVLRNLADARDIEASDLEDIAGQTTIVEKLMHDCYLLNAAANAIRALAPRKEG